MEEIEELACFSHGEKCELSTLHTICYKTRGPTPALAIGRNTCCDIFVVRKAWIRGTIHGLPCTHRGSTLCEGMINSTLITLKYVGFMHLSILSPTPSPLTINIKQEGAVFPGKCSLKFPTHALPLPHRAGRGVGHNMDRRISPSGRTLVKHFSPLRLSRTTCNIQPKT